MIPISVNLTLQHISNPTNNIASHLSSVKNPSHHSIKDYIQVPSLQQLTTTNSTPNKTNPQIINKQLIAEQTQNNKTSSVSIRNHYSIPFTYIAPKLSSVKTPSPSTIKYSIPPVSSLKYLPPADIDTNATHPENRNTNVVIASKQTPKTYSPLRKRLSSSHLPSSTNILGTDK